MFYDSSRRKFVTVWIFSESKEILIEKKMGISFKCFFWTSACRTLSNVTNTIVNVDYFKIHENKDGSVDKTKTDLYMHLVDKRDNSIFEVADVLRLIDQNVEKLDILFKVK